MTCQALPRKRYNNPGWECDGTGLVVVLWTGGLPIVCPEARGAELTEDPELGVAYRVERFFGGDHYHAVLGRGEHTWRERCCDADLSKAEHQRGVPGLRL